MKCEKCKLDLSSNSKFIRGISKVPNTGDLVGYEVSIMCPHCSIIGLIPIADYYKFCSKRIKHIFPYLKIGDDK